MKKALVLTIVVVAMISECLASDGSATKTIDRNKKASGGSALSRVRSTLIIGAVKSADGRSGRFMFQTASPSNLRIDIEIAGSRESECYNGKSAWRLDSSGLRTLLSDDSKRLRLEALLFNTHLSDLQKNRIVPKFAGRTSIEGRAADALEFLRDNVRIKLFFDSQTNLLIKKEREIRDGIEEVQYGDYRLVDGVNEPFSLRIRNATADLSITVERIEHNRNVVLSAFRYPQSDDARPLPNLETLMKTIIANQEKTDEMRERYTCRLVEIERRHDGDGRIKGSDTRVYEVTPVGHGFVKRLMSLNGKELSASERDKEDKRVQNEVEEIIKRREKKQQQIERAEARGEKPPKEEVNLTILDFLRVSEITSIRREMFRGYEVIAFDFEPRTGFKPMNRPEEIVNKLAGTIWVDETALQVVRLEARFTDSFKIGGGLLASIAPSTSFVFEQEKIGDEVWLPSLMEANISARLMLFAKLSRSRERRFGDYKKYQVDSKYELNKPKDH